MNDGSSPITIRFGTPNDLDAIVALQCALTEETEHITPDEPRIRSGVNHLLNDSRLGRYLVAVDPDKTAVGCVMITSEWSTWTDRVVWWIHDVYVHPAWRRQGVFHQLYAHIRAEIAADPTIRGIRLYAAHDNQRARRIYEQLGFRNDHYVMYEWLPDEQS